MSFLIYDKIYVKNILIDFFTQHAYFGAPLLELLTSLCLIIEPQIAL